MLLRLSPGADPDDVRAKLMPRLKEAEVLTTSEVRDRTVGHWLFGTGAGAALIAGAALGVLVGAVIVGQSLYASTREYLPEFATLRALGLERRLHPPGHSGPGVALCGDRLCLRRPHWPGS